MQHLMHHSTVSLQQSKITLQNNCINNTSITQPTLSKVFEYCILDRFGLFLTTSDNQFGFKKGVGCNLSLIHI